jgi:hypothetical protein
MDDLIQQLKNYITDEQLKNMNKTTSRNKKPRKYDFSYYDGYYNGYLTALYNIKSIMIKYENDNSRNV